MEYYSLTVRKLGHKRSYEEYIEHLKSFPSVEIHKVVYEPNKQQGGVHMHGLIAMAKSFIRKKICKYGFNIKYDRLESMKDKLSWESYISKYNDPEQLFKERSILSIIDESVRNTQDAKEVSDKQKGNDKEEAIHKKGKDKSCTCVLS